MQLIEADEFRGARTLAGGRTWSRSGILRQGREGIARARPRSAPLYAERSSDQTRKGHARYVYRAFSEGLLHARDAGAHNKTTTKTEHIDRANGKRRGIPD